MAIYALGDLEPDIDPTAYVHPLAVVIGSVELGPEASVWPHAVLRGDDGLIRIGARSNVQDGAVIHCTPVHPTIVGEDCTIGHLAHIEGCVVYDRFAHRHRLGGAAQRPDRPPRPGRGQRHRPGGLVVPANAMALGTPARIRPDALAPDANLRNSEVYAERGRRYRPSCAASTDCSLSGRPVCVYAFRLSPADCYYPGREKPANREMP